jgi:thiosulfate/3-mercaptopyruvate sulfurtransferase
MPYPNPAPLISTAELAARLDDPRLRLFDTTVHLGARPGGGYAIESGRADYDRGHVPGAGFIDMLTELSDTTSKLPFMLPPEAAFADCMGRHGVGPGTEVVLYNAGPTWWATRAWFMLREYGFDAARVLDGGLDKWRAERRALSAEPCRYVAATFVPGPRRRVFVDKDEVLRAVRARDRHIVNALSPDVFSGKAGTYGRPGRIATSVNVFARDLLDPQTQAFLPAAELAARLQRAGILDGRPAIHYCGGGISATTDAFAMTLLGYDDVTIYDASMTEWGRDPSLPMDSDAP